MATLHEDQRTFMVLYNVTGLAQDSGSWQVLVNAAMKLQVT